MQDTQLNKLLKMNHPSKYPTLVGHIYALIEHVPLEEAECILAILWRDLFFRKMERDGDKFEEMEGKVHQFLKQRGGKKSVLPPNIGRFPAKLKKKNGEAYAMVEPQRLALRDMEKLIDICKKNGLYFHVDGESPIFPGRHMRILFSKYKWR